jgi:hypothetical protein
MVIDEATTTFLDVSTPRTSTFVLSLMSRQLPPLNDVCAVVCTVYLSISNVSVGQLPASFVTLPSISAVFGSGGGGVGAGGAGAGGVGAGGVGAGGVGVGGVGVGGAGAGGVGAGGVGAGGVGVGGAGAGGAGAGGVGAGGVGVGGAGDGGTGIGGAPGGFTGGTTAAAWLTWNIRPAMVTAPSRGSARSFAAILTPIVPSPCPADGEVIDTHES